MLFLAHALNAFRVYLSCLRHHLGVTWRYPILGRDLRLPHMRWTKPNIRNGMHSLLGRSGPAVALDRNARIATLREAMLACLESAELSDGRQCVQVLTRIRYSSDVEDLWYLRGDIVALLSATHGELAARESVDGFTSLFDGLLPRSLTTRPARLRN